MEVRKIKLRELELFINGTEYNSFIDKPITPLRVNSQINNPRAEPDDVVLYLILKNNVLIAYRSLFSDFIIQKEERIKFAWCSGNWVHPEYRRQGLSQKLLKEAYDDWNGRLMFTNYAPSSLNLYIKSGLFTEIFRHNGVRCYLFPKTLKFLGQKRKLLKPAFFLIDNLISFFVSFRLLFYKEMVPDGFTFDEVKPSDKGFLETIAKNKNDLLFTRSDKEFQWMFNFPWISNEDKGYFLNYYFSSFSTNFYYRIIRVSNNNESGYFVFSVRDGHLKTLYFYIHDELYHGVVYWLKNFCKKNKIEYLTVYNSKLSEQFKSCKYPFLKIKEYGQGIFSSFDFEFSGDKIIQDGDGDNIFT